MPLNNASSSLKRRKVLKELRLWSRLYKMRLYIFQHTVYGAKLFAERNQIKCPRQPFVAYAIWNYARIQVKLVQNAVVVGGRGGVGWRTDRRGSKGNVRVSQVRSLRRGRCRDRGRPATTLNGNANGIECSCAFLQFKFLIEITNWCQRDEAGRTRIRRLRMWIRVRRVRVTGHIYKYVYEKKIAKNKN